MHPQLISNMAINKPIESVEITLRRTPRRSVRCFPRPWLRNIVTALALGTSFALVFGTLELASLASHTQAEAVLHTLAGN